MTFTMMIGIPGSGKTTVATSLPGVYLSSDKIREELYGDAAIQGSASTVFHQMFLRTLAALDAGRDVIYDATNINRKKRLKLITDLRQRYAFLHIKMIVMAVPPQECLCRDLKRERTVGAEVIKRMLKNFQMPLPDEYDEIDVRQNDTPLDCIQLLTDMNEFNQDNPHHSLTLDKHCAKAAELARMDCCSDNIITALQYHDCGKIYTKTLKDKVAHYYNHGEVGAYLVLCSNMTDFARLRVAQLICYHMNPYFDGWSSATFPAVIKTQLNTMHIYDVRAH